MRGDVDTAAFTALASVTSIRYPGVPGSSWRQLTNVAQELRLRPVIERLVRSTGARIIHAHTEGLGPVIAPMAAPLNCRSVMTLHGLNTDPRFLHAPGQRRRFRRALNELDLVVLVGEPLRPFFRELAGRDDHFRVVHNGLEIDAIPARRTELLSGGAPVRFISVSHLHEGKGIDVTLRALAQARDAGFEDWTFTIVGDGDQERELVELVREMRLRQVTFTGGQPRENVFALLSEADVFVLPSYREAFGIAYLEAMAAGLVTIGVRGQGPSAFIEHGINGFLVNPKDPDDLARLLLQIPGDAERMRAIGAAARRTVRSGFTWDAHAEKLLACCDEILQQDVRGTAQASECSSANMAQ
jgi:glycosyltransferase involved in cell wall biosynthesis